MLPIIVTFDEWMKRVDSILEAKYFVSFADLPDQCYADWFNDGITPASAARKAYLESEE